MSKSRSAGGNGGGKGRRPQAPKRADPRYPRRGMYTAPRATDSFTCGHCGRVVGALPSGGHHRNHCPHCLYSRHVDAATSGDRASACRGLMEPIGAFQRPNNGEHVVVHRCLGCGFERFNRIAADDDFDLVLALPVLPPRSAHPSTFPSHASAEPGEVPPAAPKKNATL